MSSISPIKSYPLTSTTSPLTNVNSVTFVQDSEFGRVASFNGSNYLLIERSDVPSQVYGQNWSFSFWAKNNNVNSTKEPFAIGVNSTKRRITANIDTNVFLGYSGSNSIGSETAPMNLQSNVWYHYCFVRSGSNFKFYIDGLKVIDDVSSGVRPSSTSFKIGTNHELKQRWDGYMTDVRIYGVSLSDSEALALSSNPHTSGTVDPNLVTWVINNGSYEVSSKNHLLQIMNSGSLFTNTGSIPTDYKSASYIQTVDIDLESDSTNIVPISTFTGVFDGQGYSISNWNCTPLSGKGTALFGITVNATIKNLVLDGVWQALGTNDGAFLAAHNTSSQFYNITTDFSLGTEITARINSLGGLFAYTGSCILQNITMGGTIDRLEGTAFTGGIVGYSGYGSGTSVSYVRNIATFTNGMITTGSNEVGGIFGYCSGDTVTHVMNAMTGSIQGPSRAGGVFGNLVDGSTNYICNSMVGNISGSVAAATAASVSGSGACTHWVNYMSGDVTSGLVGTVTSRVFSSCIVAMKGATTYAAFQSGHSTSEVLLDDSYGITYTSNLGTVSTMDTSSFDSASQYNLPSWTFLFTDNAGNQLDWPFVFGNGTPSETGPPRYQSDPPVTGAVAYLRVHDLASLEDGDTISSWGTASSTGSPKYRNNTTDFPYVELNGGFFTLGRQTIQPSLGFTFVGHVLTTSVGSQYPLIYSYAEGGDNGIRIYRTGGSGQDLVFRSQKAASIEARADDATTTNTWQVFTSRVTDNGDSTLTMEIFIDNVLQGSVTEASSDMSGIVSGLLEVGQSTAWTSNPVSPIYISDVYFYDRALSDTELAEMHTYFNTLGTVQATYDQVQVRLGTSTADNITIVEFQLFNKDNENIALLGTASQTSDYSSFTASKAIDGNLSSSDFSHTAHGNTTPEPAWTLDLDRGYSLDELNKIVFYNRSGYEYRADGYVITLISSTGVDPLQVGVCTDELIQEFAIPQSADDGLSLSPQVLSAVATIAAVESAVSYRLTIQRDGLSTETTVHDNIQPEDLRKNIVSLTPETTYIVRLHVDRGGGYELSHTKEFTTLENIAPNYDLSVYESSEEPGIIDITAFADEEKAAVNEVADELFTTGDIVDVSIAGNAGNTDSVAATFVNIGGNIDASVPDSIFVPFTQPRGSGQEFTIEISDLVQEIGYNESNNAVTVEGVEYSPGESFVVGNKRFSVVDF